MIYKWTLLDGDVPSYIYDIEYWSFKSGEVYKFDHNTLGVCYKDGKEFLEPEMETYNMEKWKVIKANKKEIRFYHCCIELEKI